MKKLVLLSLCSLFLVSCGSDFLENEKSKSDFLENEKLKYPERFYYTDGVDKPWFGKIAIVYDEDNRIEYKFVKDIKETYATKTELVQGYITRKREFTKIKLSDNSEITIDSSCYVSEKECGYCVKTYAGDVICTQVIQDTLFADNEYEYYLVTRDGEKYCKLGKKYDFDDYLKGKGYFNDYCYKSDEDDYKEFYNIKD